MKRQLAAELRELGISVTSDGLVKVSDIKAALLNTRASIGGEEDFKTEVKVDVLENPEGVPEHAELLTETVYLSWRLYIDTRDWGVKSLGVHVLDQEVELVFMDEETKKEQTVTVKISEPEIEYPRDSFGGALRGWGIRPRSLEISNKDATVSFDNRA